MIELDIFSDVICPWCLIGKRRLERALVQHPEVKARITWRAFQLNPDMPRDGMSRQLYVETKFGGTDRAKAVYDNIRAQGGSEDLDFAFEKIQRTPNTVDAHRLIRRATELEKADPLVEALFAAYFFEGRDIGDHEELAKIGAEAGLDHDEIMTFLASDDGEAEVQAETQFAFQNGITGVPCFIINRRYAVSGAQPPEAFTPLFDLALQEAAETELTPAK